MVSSVKVQIDLVRSLVEVGAPMAAPWRLVNDLGGTPRGAKDDLASHWTQGQITVANGHNSHRAPTDGDENVLLKAHRTDVAVTSDVKDGK